MYTFENYSESADYIKEKLGEFKPEIAMILGSGLGSLGDEITDPIIISYKDIPYFKSSTAPGHKGQLVFGYLEDKPVAVLQGRLHYYEGYSMEELVYPLRTLKLVGCSKLILTNAAGCINKDWEAGDLMLINDHIKIFLDSPLRGANIPEFGVRFPDASHIYSPEYLKIAEETAKDLGITVREGVYFYFPGPQYETPAEIRAARTLGGDAAGMSTVPEAIAAAHAGMKVLGISLLSNMAAGILDQPLTEEEVLDAAAKAHTEFSALIRNCLKKM